LPFESCKGILECVKFSEKEIADKKKKNVMIMKNDFLFIKFNRGEDEEIQRKDYMAMKGHENFFNRESRESSRILKIPDN